jgi:hypothetical protein
MFRLWSSGCHPFIQKWPSSPLLGLGLFFCFVIFLTQAIGLLGRVSVCHYCVVLCEDTCFVATYCLSLQALNMQAENSIAYDDQVPRKTHGITGVRKKICWANRKHEGGSNMFLRNIDINLQNYRRKERHSQCKVQLHAGRETEVCNSQLSLRTSVQRRPPSPWQHTAAATVTIMCLALLRKSFHDDDVVKKIVHFWLRQ